MSKTESSTPKSVRFELGVEQAVMRAGRKVSHKDFTGALHYVVRAGLAALKRTRVGEMEAHPQS